MEQQYIDQLTKSIEKLGDKFDDFSERLTRIEARFESFDRAQTHLSDKVDKVVLIANEAMASTRSAHKRLDAMDEELEPIGSIAAHGTRLDKIEKIVFWAGTTLIVTMVGVIGYLIKQGG